MDKQWTVEIDSKKHLIEIFYPKEASFDESTLKFTDPVDGKLVVDGNQVVIFDAGLGGLISLPKEISFEIAGKTAVLRKKGFSVNQDLFIEGQLIKAAK